MGKSLKILFLPQNCIPFDGKTLEKRPLGGTETGVIRLADELQKRGHTVFVGTASEQPPLTIPTYVPFRSLDVVGDVDVLVAVRDWKGVLTSIRAGVRCFWTGDAADQPATIGIGDKRVADRIDRLLCVSEWQAKTMSTLSGLPQGKARVIRNGIFAPFFETPPQPLRDKKRLIYSSTPYRGLALLPDLFEEIRKTHPDAELHAFSGYDVYQGGGDVPVHQRREFGMIAERFARLPGAKLHGNVPQSQLAKEFLSSAVLAYPCTFPETSCITVMEALAAGCVPVTSAVAALPETVGRAGVLIKGQPGSAQYSRDFVSAINELLSNQAKWQQLSDIALSRRAELSWSAVAERFEQAVA